MDSPCPLSVYLPLQNPGVTFFFFFFFGRSWTLVFCLKKKNKKKHVEWLQNRLANHFKHPSLLLCVRSGSFHARLALSPLQQWGTFQSSWFPPPLPPPSISLSLLLLLFSLLSLTTDPLEPAFTATQLLRTDRGFQ